MKQYKALIFDMGNVVFQCLPNDVYNYFSEVSNLTVTQLKKTFRPGTAYKKFERDELTPHQFYLHIKTLLESINPGAKGNAGLNENVTPGLTGSATPGLTGSATPGLAGVSEEAFEEGWNTLFGPLVPGIEELLIRLKKNYRLVALSNTNKIHAQFWKNKYARILPHFERVFCSNEIKARKPEKRAYQIVLNYLELKPGDVIFLDDMEENIEGAEGMRIQSIRVKTIPQVIQDLEGNGVL